MIKTDWYDLDEFKALMIPLPEGYEYHSHSVTEKAPVFDPKTGTLVYSPEKANAIMRVVAKRAEPRASSSE